MLKLIITLATLFFAGFLIVNDHWFITVSAFGYEVTVSSILVLLSILVLIYLLRLIKTPFRWISQLSGKRTLSKQSKREAYLKNVMLAVLENNAIQKAQLLKQKNTYFKKEPEAVIVQAFLAPDKSVFTTLSEQKETELAGLYGLYESAKKTGNPEETETVLKKATANYGNIPWVMQAVFDFALVEHDWEKAIMQLDLLKKNQLISKEDYRNGLAALHLKTGDAQKAFEADSGNPFFALSYAAENPKKAPDILMTSWRITPCTETYLAYMKLFEELPAGKQMKALKKLIAKDPTSRPALLALADTGIRLELWRDAKEAMEVYLQSYPLTKQARQLMATIIRKGWHHEEEARLWESKPIESDSEGGWICTKCNRLTTEWDILCPNCNAFDTIIYR